MNAHALIPLIATIAYVPLLVIVMLNRPWQSRQRLFVLFLIPAMLWSASDIFLRSSMFAQDWKVNLAKIVVFCAVWMIIQYRYFLQSFYKSDVARRPFAYIILAVWVGLLAAPDLPHGFYTVQYTDDVHYGYWIVGIAVVILIMTSRDIYNLIRNVRVSDNVEERNQIIYLFVGLACLAVFGIMTLGFDLVPNAPKGYPVGHIGNFLNACILTYAVVKHRLVDVRVIVRQIAIYSVLYGGGLALLLGLVRVALHRTDHLSDFPVLAAVIGLGVPAVLFLVYRVRDLWQRKVEEAFIGARSSSRRELRHFIDEVHPSLGQLGKQFISLLAESLDCRRACLLLPESERGEFSARFAYPPAADNPMAKLKLKRDNPIVTWLERENRMLSERNLAIFPEFRSIWKEEREETQSAGVSVFVPLMSGGKLVGILTVSDRRGGRPYGVEDMDLLQSIAAPVATSLESAELYARAEQKSRIDELTGLFNRRHFEERLKEEVARHSRYGDMFSILMVDLDNFKTYNDVYGHPAGDVLLNQIGKIMKNSIRDADQAFRYGGDEFIVILPQTASKDAFMVAERVRDQLAVEMARKSLTVTCSIGLASYPTDGVIAGELVTAADTALYYAKWTGGNRVYFSTRVTSESPDGDRIHGKRNGLSAVYALVSVVEARDPYVYGHSRRVNTYAVALAEAIGMSPDEVSRVSTAALLHDIGKIGIPDEVLNKKTKLSAENWEAIKAHPRLGTNIVSNIPQLVNCADSILHHHERWDGGGYPEGLKGDRIPLESRILAIADSFEAMSSARPYRSAFAREEVIEELRKCAGTQFDPNLVELFIRIVEAGLPEKAKTGQGSPSKRANP